MGQLRAHEQILESLRAQIDDGSLGVGDRLPAERELAVRFGVSRTSVREAIRVLEVMGIVSVRRGAEHGVTLRREPGNAFSTIVGLLVGLDHVSVHDIIEFRVIVETGAARALAAHGGGEALGPLLDRMEDPALPQAEFHALDAAFHVALVRAAGNALLNLVEDAVDGLLRKLVLDVATLDWDWADVRPRLEREHRAIQSAIAAREEDRAALLVSEHIRFWGSRASATPPSS
ncbi:MAG: GntR family transcriptional regulator [Solirubrobacteraceae bacterium]